MNEETGFPKYQVSAFVGGRSGKQYVFRTNDPEEFKELDKELDILMNVEKNLAFDPNSVACPRCGEGMKFEEGDSLTKKDKQGKPKHWKRNICPQCGHFEWL